MPNTDYKVQGTDEVYSEELLAERPAKKFTAANVAWAAWEHRRQFVKYFVIGFLFTLLVSFLIPSQYTSTVKLMPPDQSGGIGQLLAGAMGGGRSGGGDSLGMLAGDLLGIKTSGAVAITILQSRTVQDDIINKFDLRKRYWISKYDSTRKKLASRTEISEEKRSGVITVSVDDNDPARAQQIAQAYVDEVNKVLALISTSSARREREFLEQRLKEIKVDLDNSVKQLSQFSSEKRTLDPQTQGKAMIEAAAMLNGQLIAAESELNGLKQIYTNDNVRVRSVEARVASLKTELNKMAGTTKDPNAIYPSITELPLLGSSYVDLYRKAKIYEAVYETLTKQYELAKVQEVKEVPVIKVMDAPSYPERKSWPPRTLLALVGGILCTLFAAGRLHYVRVWNQIDDGNEWKRLLTQVGHAVQQRFNSRLSFGKRH